MDREKLDAYREAGRIEAEALAEGRRMVEGGERDAYELTLRVEETIKSEGAEPAFPCNVDIDEVAAHYSPLDEDASRIPDDGLVKLDVGVRIDGVIVDAAVTIPLSTRYYRIAETAEWVLDKALNEMMAGRRVGEIGAVIEDAATSRGFRVIRNLSGHKISDYNLHAGKSIPNVETSPSPQLEEGEVYAVEPFLTSQEGSGLVTEGTEKTIFSIAKFKRPKDDALSELYQEILGRWRGLPFSPRWLADGGTVSAVLEQVERLEEMGIVGSYPTLVEEKRMPVAQHEHTVVVEEDGVEVLTRRD